MVRSQPQRGPQPLRARAHGDAAHPCPSPLRARPAREPGGRASSGTHARHAAFLASLLLAPAALAQVHTPPADRVTPGGHTQTPPPVHIDQVGAWGGPVNCFAREGDIGVVGSGERLVVLDMADPMNFVELGAVRLGSAVMDVAFKDGFAYVMTAGVDWLGPQNHLGRRGPHVVDVRTPQAPVRAWSNEPNGFRYQWAEVDLYSNANGDMAIIRHYDHGLYLMEISDPLNPITYSGSNWRLQDVAGNLVRPNETVIKGDLMFVVALNASGRPGSFHVYDLSAIDPNVRPINPPRVASLQFGQPDEKSLQQIAVDGDRAYAAVYDYASGTQHVVAIDVSDPGAAAVVGEYGDFDSPTLDVAASNGFVYVTCPAMSPNQTGFENAPGLLILDMLSDPANPALLGQFKGRTAAFSGLRAEGEAIFLFDRGEGLVALDTSSPSSPTRLGAYYSPAVLRQMQKHGDLLYLSDCWNGLTILDVSDPKSSEVVGTYQPAGVNNWGLDLQGRLAYLCTSYGGLEVLDVSDPTAPELVGAVREPPYGQFYHGFEGIFGVEVLDGVAYVGAQVGGPGWTSSRAFSFDVTDPAAIAPIDPDGAGIAGDMRMLSFEHDDERGLLFGTGAQGSRGLALIDINDPDDLQVFDDFGLEHLDTLIASSLAPDRDVLAVVDCSGYDQSGGLSLLDVSDPYAPAVLSKVPMDSPGAVTQHPLGTLVVGRAPGIAPDGWVRVLLLDTSDSSKPAYVASAPLPSGNPAAPYGLPGTHLLTDGPVIYVTSAWPESGDFGFGAPTTSPGLTIYAVHGVDYRRRSDYNRDGLTDSRDLLAYLSDARADQPAADLDGDGDTDSHDLQAFLELFTRTAD